MKTDDFLSLLIANQKITAQQKGCLTNSQYYMFAHTNVQQYILDNQLSKEKISLFIAVALYDSHFLVWQEPYLTLIANAKLTHNHSRELSLLAKSWQLTASPDNTKIVYRSLYAWIDRSPYLATLLDMGLLTPELIKIIRGMNFYLQLPTLEENVFKVAIAAHHRGVTHLDKALEKLITYRLFAPLLQKNFLKADVLSLFFDSPPEKQIQTLITGTVLSNHSSLKIFISSQWDTPLLLQEVPALTNIILFHLLSDKIRYLNLLYFLPNINELITQVNTQNDVPINSTILNLLQQIPVSGMKLDHQLIYDDLRIKMFSRFLVMAKHEPDNPARLLPPEVLTLIAANAARETSPFTHEEKLNLAHRYVTQFSAKKTAKRTAADSTLSASSSANYQSKK